MSSQETLYRMALTRLLGIGIIGAHNLLKAAGSATCLFENRKNLSELIPGIAPHIAAAFDAPETLRICEAELRFAEKNQIQCLTEEDEAYPSRLRECSDAPIVLFYRGNADLNQSHVISMVGTRHATEYGKDLCLQFVRQLQELLPDTLIVSGLAYGIDIHAHRASLQQGLETIGVLAHGLDRIYPAAHRGTAAEMLRQGGLLTEFMSGTNPDRQNFIKRNRIIAGMSDATIVVESAEKGGSLITADIAESYHRDCFAFPGRITDPYSAGCNLLIRTNRASLIQSAEELVEAMNWKETTVRPQAIQRQLFPELSEEEEKIIECLKMYPDGMQINTLVVQCNIPVNRMASLLFDMEMKGMVRTLAGGMYRLLQ